MRSSRRGFTLFELIAATAIMTVVLSTGYRLWQSVNKADDYQARREEMTLASQNLMATIKRDVRAATSVSASGGRLTVRSPEGITTYSSLQDGVRRAGPSGGGWFAGADARFNAERGGVRVTITSDSIVYRRPIHIEISSFVSPRN